MTNRIPSSASHWIYFIVSFFLMTAWAKSSDELLIDGHGIQVEIGAVDDSEHALTLDVKISPEARDLIRESRNDPFDYADRWALLTDEDSRQIIEAVQRSWRWYDHFVNEGKHNASDLKAPKVKIKSERNSATAPHVYEGICEDGYFLTYRPKPSKVYGWKRWWCTAGRVFEASNGETVRVELSFDKDGQDSGSISLGEDKLLKAKPGSETLDGEIRRRYQRSPKRVIVQGRSFQTTLLRLEMLCGNRWTQALSICNGGDGAATFSIRYVISPHANVKAIEALELGTQSSRSAQNTETESTTRGGSTTFSLTAEAGAEVSVEIPPKVTAGVRAGFEKTSSWKDSWVRKSQDSSSEGQSARYSIPLQEFKKLPERNPYLFALGLFGALKPLANFVVDGNDREKLPIQLLLSEAEVTLQKDEK